MNGKFLLDTNIVIAFLTDDESIQRPNPTDQLYVSCTVIGEMFYGAFNSNQIEENTDRVVEFVRDTVSVPCSRPTAICWQGSSNFRTRWSCPSGG